MQRNRYSSEFKEQAISKVRQRGSRTLESVANELNISLGRLKGWLKASNHKVAEAATLASLPSGHCCPTLEFRAAAVGP